MLSKRRAFFFGITMSEIAFILFFAMLLFAFFRFAEDKETIAGDKETIRAGEVDLKKCRENLILIEDLQEKIRQAIGDPDIDDDELIRRMVEVDQLTAELGTTKQLIEKLEKKLGSCESFFKEFDEAGLPSDSPDGSSREYMRRALALLQKLELWIRIIAPLEVFDSPEDAQEFALEAAQEKLADKESREDKVDPNETLEEAQQRANNARDRLQYCMDKLNRCRGGGRDLPPCWVNAENPTRVDFLLKVDIYDDGIDISRGSELDRQDDFLRVPGASDLLGSRINMEKFKKHAQVVFDHSDELKIPCRHYALIRYHPRDLSTNWTRTVDDYFYIVD